MVESQGIKVIPKAGVTGAITSNVKRGVRIPERKEEKAETKAVVKTSHAIILLVGTETSHG